MDIVKYPGIHCGLTLRIFKKSRQPHRQAENMEQFRETDDLINAGKTSLLPQYIYSQFMHERFLDAALFQSEEIERAENKPGIKLADGTEIEYDNLKFFIDKKAKFEEEFFQTLSERITEEKANLFCEIISKNWFDGRVRRGNNLVKKLMVSIKNYLLEYRKVKNENGIRVINKIDKRFKPNFEDDEIDAIILLNREMLDGHIHDWLKGHPNHDTIATGSIHCRRGMFLEKEFENEEYLEWSYINSYSLAFSVTEKFSRMVENKKAAIVNTNLTNIRERSLFFSPFIKGMPPEQFEFGVIPHWWTMNIKRQGMHGEIVEYLVD